MSASPSRPDDFTVGDQDRALQPVDTSRLLRRATRASVAVSVGLVLAKTFAWFSTGSVAVLASLLDSVMDTVASLINLVAVDYSLKPADKEHRYGHGKAEALAGLGQSLLITGSALFLIYQAGLRFLDPQQLANVEEATWILILAMTITAALVAYQRYVVRLTGSTAVAADSLHYLSDLFTNAATLIALFLISQGWLRADSVIGLAIGIYILISAVNVGRTAVRILMDTELPESERETIITCVESTEGVVAVKSLRTWRSGQRRVVNIEVIFSGNRPLQDVHINAKLITARLLELHPEMDVSIHPVPETG